MGMAAPTSAASAGVKPASSSPASDPYFCQQVSPNVGMVNILNAVASPLITVSMDPSVWAVGYVSNPNSMRPSANTLAMHFNGKEWSIVPTPNVAAENYLNGVAVRTSDNVWAVGYSIENGVERPLVMRYTGAYWKIVQLPLYAATPVLASGRLNSVAMLGDTGVVAVGSYSYGMAAPMPLALYYDGTTWSKMDVPAYGKGGRLYGVTADGPGVWAVGSADIAASGDLALLYRYDGKTWTAVAKGTGYLSSVAVTNAGVIAVGDVTGKAGKETLAMLYNSGSGSFARVTSYNFDVDHNFLTSIVSQGKDIYAVGYSGVPGNDYEMVPLVLRYNGKTFSPLSAPHVSTVDKLAGVTVSNGNVWAVGSYMKGEFGRNTLVLNSNCFTSDR